MEHIEQTDLYFHGIKKDKPKYNEFVDDIFVIDSWPNTKEKEDTLIRLIERLKVFGCPILLCGHYPVDNKIFKNVDYYLYIKDNDLLLEKDFEEYGVSSDRWSDFYNYKLINKNDFHHDYAIWCTMKMAFNFVNQLNKKYIHFLEYDNLPNEFQYKQAFIEFVRWNDAVVYEYDKGSTKLEDPYSSAYIFSIKTDVALKMVNLINSKEEFFKNKPHRWQLEKQLYQSIKKVTDSIYVSKYMENENELNLFAVWNRNGILRNGGKFQIYFGVDDYNNLYVHFISGFDNSPADKDYVVEINYINFKKFWTIKIGAYDLVKIGKYEKDKIVRIFYKGVNVLTQQLSEPLNEFRRKNKVIVKNKAKDQLNTRVNINFIDGPFVEILNDNDSTYHIEFINKRTNAVEYSLDMKSNSWARCNKKYFIDWNIKIRGIDNDFAIDYNLNLENKNIFICFETKSLGDNLAMIPYVEEFREKYNCNVTCSTFFNSLFIDQYPKIKFVEPGSTVNNLHALYRIGLFYTENRVSIDWDRHPSHPCTIPLQQIASDILGLEFKEIKPNLKDHNVKKRKRVSIAVHSTCQAKYWNNPTGWQKVVDYLKSKNYEVRLLSREEDGYMGNFNPKGVVQQAQTSTDNLVRVLQESELFIGISSGLSWLAWGSGTPTILISGFSDTYLEPQNGIKRIINKDVCNSCWNTEDFNPGDWNWCPRKKNTHEQFICSKSITAETVIKAIDEILKFY